MNYPVCKVECAKNQDIPAMLSLEKRYFESCWHSEAAFIRKLIEKDPMMFRVCKIGGEVRGYYWVIPLGHSVWKKVLNGEMNETEAMYHIKSFDESDLYLYICSVIVDLDDKRHKHYTKALVRDFGRNFVVEWEKDTPDVNAIGAFTISDGGRRLMERSNFDYKGTFKTDGKLVRSYAVKRSTLAQRADAARRGNQHKKIA